MIHFLALFSLWTALVAGEAGYSYRAPSGGGSFGSLSGSGGYSGSGSSGFSTGPGSYSGGGSDGYARGGYPISGGGGGLVQKHIYVHVAPEEPQEQSYRAPIQTRQPQTHYKIVFIKAPTPPTPTALSLPPPVQDISKTLIYVLVKKPEDAPELRIPTAAPTQPSKPEVYFIRYKTQKSSSDGYGSSGYSGSSSGLGASGLSGLGGSGFGASGGIDFNSGSRGNLSPSYGVPSGGKSGY